MLMSLYILFVAVAIILIFLGFGTDVTLFSIIGTIMLFILGGVLLDEGITYKSGTISNETLVDNVTHVETQDVYSNYDDAGSNRFGWFLMALGALSFIYLLYVEI